MTVSTIPKVNSDRYRAAKAAVRARCAHLKLCQDATTRCVDRAAALIRAGRSAAVAAAEGVALAKRLARLSWARGAVR